MGAGNTSFLFIALATIFALDEITRTLLIYQQIEAYQCRCISHELDADKTFRILTRFEAQYGIRTKKHDDLSLCADTLAALDHQVRVHGNALVMAV